MLMQLIWNIKRNLKICYAEKKKHGKLACYVYVLLMAKRAKSPGSIHREYPAP